MVKRYKEHLKQRDEAEAGPGEEEESSMVALASDNPLIVMIDEENWHKYMRSVDKRGFGEDGDLSWLVQDMHQELKSWGHPGGARNALILKSDGEPAIVAVREALARCHGGLITPEQPPRGEHQANGAAEEACRTTRDHARVLEVEKRNRH